jgi:hypothetical protein
MKQYIQTAKNYFSAHKKKFSIGVGSVLVIVVLITLIVLAVKNNETKIVYQPANACDLLTREEAQELLGSSAIHSSMIDPALSGDTATSKCAYTNGNPDVNNMVVAAIVVRSGVNDKGVKQNNKEFDTGRPTKDIETVKGLGDKAYFNKDLGQLNVLSGYDWIILSNGTGSAPSTNTLKNAVNLANKVLKQKSV